MSWVAVVVGGAFDLHPLDGVAGNPVFGREGVYVLFVGAIDAGSEKAHRVGRNAFAGDGVYVEIANAGLRGELARAYGACLAGAAGVDANGLVVAAGPDLLQVRMVPEWEVVDRSFLSALAFVEPASDSTATDPNGVA